MEQTILDRQRIGHSLHKGKLHYLLLLIFIAMNNQYA